MVLHGHTLVLLRLFVGLIAGIIELESGSITDGMRSHGLAVPIDRVTYRTRVKVTEFLGNSYAELRTIY